jgi:hypothetical protein
MIGVGDLYARDEDDGELLEARMLADHRGELEAVDLRHHHVDQYTATSVLSKSPSASCGVLALIRFSPSSPRMTS